MHADTRRQAILDQLRDAAGPISAAALAALLKTTSQTFHQTIVMITHNPEIAQLADRVVRIEDGKILAS